MITLHFPTEQVATEAINPLSLTDLCSQWGFEIKVGDGGQHKEPPRYDWSPVCGTTVFENSCLEVYIPTAPQREHHLAIAIKRPIKAISEINPTENQSLYETLSKIIRIYRTLNLEGCHISMWNQPQEGHANRCVVELLPHLPGFHEVKNLVEKFATYRYTLFRQAPITHPLYAPPPPNPTFWTSALQQPLLPPKKPLTYPVHTLTSHREELHEIFRYQMMEYFESKGATVMHRPEYCLEIPTIIQEPLIERTASKCR